MKIKGFFVIPLVAILVAMFTLGVVPGAASDTTAETELSDTLTFVPPTIPPTSSMDEQIEGFLGIALDKAGAEELITPREIIRDYLTLLNILRDNEGAKFEDLIGKVSFGAESESTAAAEKASTAIATKKITIFDIEI